MTEKNSPFEPPRSNPFTGDSSHTQPQPPPHATPHAQPYFPPASQPQPYSQHQPMPYYQYGVSPHYGVSPKSKVVGVLLAFFLGTLGLHDFYMGRPGRGVAKIGLLLFSAIPLIGFLTGVPLGIWVLVDLVSIIGGFGTYRTDGQGRPLNP